MKKHNSISRILGIVLATVLIGAVLPLEGFGTHSQVAASPAIIYVPDDYSTIQAAVNASSPGDTIIVRDGTYIENVDVNKDHLTIQSENGADTTVVQPANPADHIFEVTADYVTISGFTAQGTGGAAVLLADAYQCSISYNHVLGDSSTYYGIYLNHASNSTILGNSISDCVYGTYLIGSSQNIIEDNALDGCGIALDHSYDNTVANNTATGDYGAFVWAYFASRNIIRDNQACSSDEWWDGVKLTYSSDNVIVGNQFSYDKDATFRIGGGYGIHIVTSCQRNLISRNTISNTIWGVYIQYSSGNIIEHNNLVWTGVFTGRPGNIFEGNMIMHTDPNGDVISEPILYLKGVAGESIQNMNVGQVILEDCRNVVVRNCSTPMGFLLLNTTGSTVTDNYLSMWDWVRWASQNGFGLYPGALGIYLQGSSDNLIDGNRFDYLSSESAITLWYSHGNTIICNHLDLYGRYAFYMNGASDNRVYRNNVLRGIEISAGWIMSDDSVTSWYSPEPVVYMYDNNTYVGYLGNYWIGYNGTDVEGDGIGDTPHLIHVHAGDADNIDNYPLIVPFENYQIGPGLADSPWPKFRHDAQNTGRSPYTGPQTPELKWTLTIGGKVSSSPAIGVDGSIYVGSWDGKLYAINHDGTEKWNFTTGDSIADSSPAIAADGTIYVGSIDGNLYAVNADGTEKWRFNTGRPIYSSPAVGANGTIYLGAYNGNLYAINPDGTLKWSSMIGQVDSPCPAIGTDGTIYVGSDDCSLYAVYADGTRKWSFTTGNLVESSPAIAADGTIYVGSYDNNLYAIDRDGTEKWNFTAESSIYCSPAIGPDGTIYVGSQWPDNNLYAINPDGTEKWRFTDRGIRASPAVDRDGTIYIPIADTLHAINPDGTEKWSLTVGSGIYYASPAIGADGTIYVGSVLENKLYAIGEGAPPEEVDVVHVDYIFAEEEVFYNPLLPPDSVYLYYLVDYTADSEYLEEDTLVPSSDDLPFSLASNDQATEVTSCRVYKTFTKETIYEAILQFEVPFSPTSTVYTLNIADFSVPITVIPQLEDIRVEDVMASYVGVGGGVSFGPKFKVALLGNKVEAQAGGSYRLEIGASGGYESEINYSGLDPSDDHILFGFPIGGSGQVEGELKVGAELGLTILVIDANLVKESVPVKGYGSDIQYPLRANIGEDKHSIAGFIVPIIANTITGSPAALLQFASILPFDVYSPYKEIDRKGFAFSPEVDVLGGGISFGAPGVVKVAKLEGSVFEAGSEYSVTWEDGQENGEPVHTHSVDIECSTSALDFENGDLFVLGARWLSSEKTGQIGNDKYIVETGYEPDTTVLKEGELYINRWAMNEADFSKLYDDSSLSLENLPEVYETTTIKGLKFYQPKPEEFHMDVLEINLGLGVEGKAILSLESQHKERIPVATTYASSALVYNISDTAASSIQGKFADIESYAKPADSVLFDSLKANIEAVTQWVQKVFLGLKVEIQSLINDVGNKLEVFARETGRKIVDISTKAADKAKDFTVTVWTGMFNPPAAVNNAILDFASHIVVIDQKEKGPIPEGTAVTIYPKDGLVLDDLSDVSVYTFSNGYWTIIPSLQNSDGSFTFILRSAGIYALIHNFPLDSDFLTETLVNMAPNTTYTLTSNPVRNSDGSTAANSTFNITLMKAAVVSTDGTTITFGESPVAFPEISETDSNGQLSIPIHSGDLEGEAYLQIKADSGYCAQIARIIVSQGEGIDDSFTVAINMTKPSEGMAVVNQDVEFQAITSYPTPDAHWGIVDSFGNKQSYVGHNVTFNPIRSGLYGVYCFAKDENGFTHTAYAELPVTDPTNDTDGDGVSDNLEHYYGSDPDVPDSDELYDAMEGNRPPIADAGGPYEAIEGMPVTLSALASFDPDGDPLTYTWTRDGNVAYGINPTLQLPAGTTTVTLVVNDGKVDSEPDTVAIAVRIPATIDFDPDVLHLSRARRGSVRVYIELPQGYDAGQIDLSSIRLNGIVPALARPTKVGDYDRDRILDLMVKFSRAAVRTILTPGEEAEIAITGEVAGIPFIGTDTIRVINA